MKNQRGTGGLLLKAFLRPDKNGVISGHLLLLIEQFKTRTTARQKRYATQTRLPGQARESIDRPSGKARRQILLRCAEDMDGMVSSLLKRPQIVGLIIQTPERQRRGQGNCRKRINSQPHRMSIRIHCRDHRHACGKATQRTAQRPAIVGRSLHGAPENTKTRIIRSLPNAVEIDAHPTPLPLHAARRFQPRPPPLSFTERIIAWQLTAGRHDLPWQGSGDAYRIWLSEIMLQQTQVSTVIDYYLRFVNHFPDVHTLAAAPMETVMARWAGLGYYARARNLHRCAEVIVSEHGGRFPSDPEQLALLPGIGRSTAAAIAAFAFGRRAAILDGNVKRVFCRHFGISGFPGLRAVEQQLWALAEHCLPETDIGPYTQGLMDLGATVCTRRNPDCGHCPVTAECQARLDGRQQELPTPKPKKPRPEKDGHFIFFVRGNRLLLQRRPSKGIWGGLLVPPEGRAEDLLARPATGRPNLQALPRLTHNFTHFKLHIEAWVCILDDDNLLALPEGEWHPIETAATVGVPAPMAILISQVASAVG